MLKCPKCGGEATQGFMELWCKTDCAPLQSFTTDLASTTVTWHRFPSSSMSTTAPPNGAIPQHIKRYDLKVPTLTFDPGTHYTNSSLSGYVTWVDKDSGASESRPIRFDGQLMATSYEDCVTEIVRLVAEAILNG